MLIAATNVGAAGALIKQPTMALKATVAIGGVLMIGGIIGMKNIAGNVTSNIGKKNLIIYR
jgi:hypothetical protein